MIEELFQAFEESGANAGPEELAEILWLAARIDGTSVRTTDHPYDAHDADNVVPSLGQEPPWAAADGDPRSAEQFYSAADMTDTSGSAARSVDLVRIRRAASLRDPLAVMRALRPLGRRSGPPGDAARSELDEELTVRNTIEQCLPVPVMRARRGRWLDLALVVDAHHSMLLWHDLVTELRRAFIQTGIFRDVRPWYLSGTGPDEVPSVSRTAGGVPRSVQEVSDPSGHRLVLVVTDTVAGGWSTSGVQDTLRRWSSHGPVALLNVLPRRLWDRGAVQPQPLMVRAARPAAPNMSWRLGHAGGSRRRERHRRTLAESTAIPIVEASAGSISALAELVAGSGRWSRLSCLTITRRPEGLTRPRPTSPDPSIEPPATVEETLRRFRADASPVAQSLAGYLSAVPLNLPVMNLVRQIMLPESEPGHLAEVALSGLFEPWEREARADMERMPFRFRAGVREALLGSQQRHEITTVQVLVRREMGAFVTERGSGPVGDFLAARGTADGEGSRAADPDALPFAERPGAVGRPVRETPASQGEHLLDYVERAVDARLREIMGRAVDGHSVLVLLVGEPGSGKSHAMARVIHELPDEWRVWSPDVSLTLEEGAPQVGPRVVVTLEDFQTYTTASDIPAEATARVVRDLIEGTERAPIVVLGTLTPSAWDTFVAVAEGAVPGEYDNLRQLIARAEVIRIHPVDAAVETTRRFHQAPPLVRALLRAALDIRRLGHGPDLSRALLEAAAPAYVPEREHALLRDAWRKALDYACETPLNGSAIMLRLPGNPPVYRLSDSVEQLDRDEVPRIDPPEGLWTALAQHADPRSLPELASRAREMGLEQDARHLETAYAVQEESIEPPIAVRQLVAGIENKLVWIRVDGAVVSSGVLVSNGERVLTVGAQYRALQQRTDSRIFMTQPSWTAHTSVETPVRSVRTGAESRSELALLDLIAPQESLELLTEPTFSSDLPETGEAVIVVGLAQKHRGGPAIFLGYARRPVTSDRPMSFRVFSLSSSASDPVTGAVVINLRGDVVGIVSATEVTRTTQHVRRTFLVTPTSDFSVRSTVAEPETEDTSRQPQGPSASDYAGSRVEHEPYFFLSYARRDDRDGFVGRFYDDLVLELRRIGVAPAAQPPFRYFENMMLGDDWIQALSTAVGRCRAFVALYSPAYIRSEYCGKEWTAFWERTQEYRGVTEVDACALVPVLWAPMAGELPEEIARLQYLEEGMGEDYAVYGLTHLLRTNPTGLEYRRVVERVAAQVRTAAHHFRLPLKPDLDLSEVHGLFPVAGHRRAAASGANHVRVFVAAGVADPLPEGRYRPEYYGQTPQEWTPYYPPKKPTLAVRAQKVIAEQGFTSSFEVIDRTLSVKLDAARRANQASVLLVDPWAAQTEPYRSPLVKFDYQHHPTTGVLVPCHDGDDESDDDRLWEDLREIFQRNWTRRNDPHDPLFWVRVGADDFDNWLARMLAVIQNRLMDDSPPRRLKQGG